MKQRHSLVILTLLLTTAVLSACSDAPKGDQATVTAAQETAAPAAGQKFKVDTTASVVRFTGNGVGKNHPGTFNLSNGTLAVAGDQVAGGQFTINMTSMQMEEQAEMFQTKLKGHLLSPDFFDVAKWGTATFEVTDVKPYTANGKDSSVTENANYNVSGNLTLKGETKNVTFPAKIDVAKDTLSAKANFDIDRTQWGIRYGNDKSLGDKFISETVNIQLDLKAAR